jgi:hypothetical protein
MYGPFNQQVFERFGSIPDQRRVCFRCYCDLLTSCAHSRQPQFDQAGALVVNLFHINGNTVLSSGLLSLIDATNCELVRRVGSESNVLPRNALEQLLGYYSGPTFRLVIQDWQRIAAGKSQLRRARGHKQ